MLIKNKQEIQFFTQNAILKLILNLDCKSEEF
jgi:hypothetical protein